MVIDVEVALSAEGHGYRRLEGHWRGAGADGVSNSDIDYPLFGLIGEPFVCVHLVSVMKNGIALGGLTLGVSSALTRVCKSIVSVTLRFFSAAEE